MSDAALAFGPFVLDRAGGRLLRAGVPVEIAPRPFAVLSLLAARPGVLVTKDELLDAVWGHRHVSDSVLKVAVNALRAALGEDAKAPTWVATVARRGYRFNAEAAAPVAAAAPSGVGNLPQPTQPLVGREADAAALADALQRSRLVTVCGPAGVGKTRLALVGASHDAPPDGVWLLRMDTLQQAADVAPALARTLGLAAGAARDDEALATALAPLRLRLLLDNAEHLDEALAPRLAAWLAAAPGLQLLLTSQRPLRLTGEQLLPLAPLPTAHAVTLFVQRVQERLPGWQADAAALADAQAIAQALDGLPLALELAAARVPLLGTAGVRQRMGAQLQLLTQGAADAPDRHRTLRAALQWSVDLLPPKQARLLESLSVFAGGFGASAVQALVAHGGCSATLDEWEVLDALQGLRDLSLVLPGDSGAAASAGEPRLRLLDSVRRLAAERLAASGHEAAAVAGHRRWLLALFEAADDSQHHCGEHVWLAPLAAEAENLTAAMSRALARPDSLAEAAHLFAASTVFCIRAGLRHAARQWLPLLRPALPFLPPSRRARLDLAEGVLGSLGQMLPPGDALAACERAAPALQSAGDNTRALYAQFHRAALLQRLGRADEIEAVHAAMVALLHDGSSPYERRLPAWVRAALQRDRGDIAAYGAFWADRLAQSRALGDTAEAWKAAWGLAQTLYLQDRLDTAIEVIDRAVDEMRGSGHLRANAPVAAQAAVLRLLRDASPETLQRLREAVLLLQSDGMVWWLADALPWAALWQGRAADARRLQAWADGLVARRGEARGPVFAKLRAAFEARLPAAASATAAPAPASEAEALALALQADAN